MKHNCRDIVVKGAPMVQCRRCQTQWQPEDHTAVMAGSCPGRPRKLAKRRR